MKTNQRKTLKKLAAALLSFAMVLAMAACAAPAAPSTPAAEPTQAPAPAQPAEPAATDEPAAAQPVAATDAVPTLSGNINAGGFVAQAGGYIFYIDGGIKRVNEDGTNPTMLLEGDFESLNAADGKLYFVHNERMRNTEYNEIQTMRQVPCSMNYDGTQTKALGEELDVKGYEYVPYDDTTTQIPSSRKYGYRLLTLYGDKLYYIGNGTVSGSYDAFTKMEEGERKLTVTYDSGAALYCMNLDGSNKTILLDDLGNADAHFAIRGSKIYYNTCYYNPHFSYDFVTYNVCDLDGKNPVVLQDKLPESEDEPWMWSSVSNVADIVLGLQGLDDTSLMVSLGGSEGDFPDSFCGIIKDGAYTATYEDGDWVKSIVTDEGVYHYTVTRPNNDETISAAAINLYDPASGSDTEVCALDGFTMFQWTDMNVVGDYIYLRANNSRVCRIAKDGTSVQLLEDGGIVAYDGALPAWTTLYNDPALHSTTDDDFAVYDIDWNNTPELITKVGDGTYDIYTIENAALKKLGTIQNTTTLYANPDGMGLVAGGKNGEDAVTSIQIITLSKGTLTIDPLMQTGEQGSTTRDGSALSQDDALALEEKYCNTFNSLWMHHDFSTDEENDWDWGMFYYASK